MEPRTLPDPAFDAATRILNRELSWLAFNERVLALAENAALPALERAKFAAIFATNLDEFFQVRVAGLKEQEATGAASRGADAREPSDQLRAIRAIVDALVQRHSHLFVKEIAPDLAASGVRFSDWDDLDADALAYLDELFEEHVFPVLTPLAVDPAHPFPYISNLSLNLAVVVRDTRDDPDGPRRPRFARVKVPQILPRFLALPDGERFVPLEQVIATHLDRLFPGMEVVAHHPFRVTRNAALEVEEEEAPDLLEAIETELLRQRFGRVVRLEVTPSMPVDVRDLLMRELEIAADDVYVVDGPLDLGGLWALHALDRPDLKDEPWPPVTPPRLAGPDGSGPGLFGVLRDGDLFVHHPYDSFAASVEAFVAAAAADPQVLAIKQTLYRTSGDSPIVRALIRAAEGGKQVVALVELKARFDEQANINWARQLEEAGVHVAYGVVGLKTHAKISLVVREEQGHICRYAHVGTGNYNPRTARLYEDCGLLTADAAVGADLTELFNVLTGYSWQRDYRRLLVAPVGLRERVVELIQEQAHEQGRIVFKVNNLVDAPIIEALYAASQAGAEIDLIVRSICCLRPGVEGVSERIRVRSLVGRYLEHSRILRFGAEPGPVRWYIGSADLMPRNLDRRVEALLPVHEPEPTARLDEILATCLADDALAWQLQPDGTWHKVPGVQGINAQAVLYQRAVERARGGGARA